jgi:hypothetical protein
MASAPQWKVFNPCGEYVAACKHVEDAACLVAMYGNGAEIRHGHSAGDSVWTEGIEEFPAGESYDRVVEVVSRRVDQRRRAAAARLANRLAAQAEA